MIETDHQIRHRVLWLAWHKATADLIEFGLNTLPEAERCRTAECLDAGLGQIQIRALLDPTILAVHLALNTGDLFELFTFGASAAEGENTRH